MTDAETRTAIATEGETRTTAELREIVLGDVSIPVRSIQRTDTSRFEGKVTFGDYTVDSDQLMSSFIQTTWAGGMNIADHIEGATDSRFRWAKAWTQASRALSLPLASVKVTGGTHAAGSATGRRLLWGTSSSANPRLNVVPLAAYGSGCIHSWGANLYYVDPYVPLIALGALADEPWNTGAWHYDPVTPANYSLWIPLGAAGVQVYDRTAGIIRPVDATIQATALLAHDFKLFAITRNVFNANTGGGDLRVRDATGTWNATSPFRQFPPDEVPLDLTLYYDRSGNRAVAILTNRQVWLYDADADAIVPLALHDTSTGYTGEAFATWRDDGLYVGDNLGLIRLSTAGVITFMGLDRDDGYHDEDPGRTLIENLIPTTNGLLAYVRGTDPTTRDLLAWNEAGWHHVSRQTFPAYDGTPSHRVTRSVVARDGESQVVWTGISASSATGGDYELGLTSTHLPPGQHAPRKDIAGTKVSYDPDGEYLSGWFDAGMMNFLKAWSHLEIVLRDPNDGTTSPPGTVDAYYRTESDINTWVHLGATTRYGRNVFQFPTATDDSGISSLKIELRLVIADTTGATFLQKTPIIEAISLKFIKLAQQGSAWQAYVALSDYDLWRGLGPKQIDDYLHRLSAEGAAGGPFVTMIHNRDVDGEPSRHRVRVAQWQRAELPGEIPYGDGVLNIIAVPIPEIPGG